MIDFRIVRRSGVAAYAQIMHQVRDAILLGRLKVGDQLPTAREVVAQTGINPNTVLKAYRQLDAEGLVETRIGSGTFVTAMPDHRVDTNDVTLTAPLADWLATARAAGLDRPSIEAIVTSQLDAAFGRNTATSKEHP